MLSLIITTNGTNHSVEIPTENNDNFNELELSVLEELHETPVDEDEFHAIVHACEGLANKVLGLIIPPQPILRVQTSVGTFKITADQLTTKKDKAFLGLTLTCQEAADKLSRVLTGQLLERLDQHAIKAQVEAEKAADRKQHHPPIALFKFFGMDKMLSADTLGNLTVTPIEGGRVINIDYRYYVDNKGKMQAMFDELRRRVIKTKGFYWTTHEKRPAIMVGKFPGKAKTYNKF